MSNPATAAVDFDEPEEAPAVPEPPPQPPAIIREVDKQNFVDTFVVHDHGKRYEVAANAIANRAMMQVNLAKLRVLGERVIKPFMDDETLVPSPKELKFIIDAFALLDGMGEAAYGDTKKGGNLGNALERLAHGMMRGAIEAGKGKSHSPEARFSRMIKVGNRAKNKKDATIDIAPAA